ncbi:2-oxo acid dehydrogenase subunit E2 [Alicyclobacillus fastidiosus]|uniref:Dihydrolipoamide acetyltransferase component of pyruvate dehydrogenase complex n=1 Tax=Alicyclobacillus fastidiosus TaxID=392011 RepID=A0ABY6ZA37_9BACL|nr:dihydrolipoamide acetyltransferase family protein [Alicyclobacillus fastidiosus]WAH39707.1 2-oxo acid dehydrogenase subunit E2 [Alicyclobacillus fastidiosus]GMA60929.1 dihydrolipoamide acetyltransferase component of pyruvate dehydrogenase complex [Alicyclobacillus fastidiosus]
MFEYKLADIGEGMHEGEIVRWLVKEGDNVLVDDPIVEVQTDKVTAELPAPVTGRIHHILAKEGAMVPVGSTLVIIADAQSKVEPQLPKRPPEAMLEDGATQPHSLVAEDRNGTVADRCILGEATRTTPIAKRALATPHIRYMARQMSIDIEQVEGTGRAGRVTEEDLKRFKHGLQAPSSRPATEAQGSEALTEAATRAPSTEKSAQEHRRVERVALRGVRKRIAEHMVKSVSVIPHVTSVDELEMDALNGLRERLKRTAEVRGVKLTFLPFFVKAVVIALREFPILNASLDDETGDILLKHYYHIGIATDTDDGLIVPVIKDADQLTVFQLAQEIASLAAAARAGRLRIDQITGGTFTISNVGSIGGLYATPIINYPEAAILGIHKMEPRNVVRDGKSVIRTMMNISLSFDHRLIDGATAVRFTNRIRSLLEDPDQLFLEMV